MLTDQTIFDQMSPSNPSLTLGAVTTALAVVDQTALLGDENSHISATLWDQATAVNGSDAADLVVTLGVAAGDAVYLITDDRLGHTSVLQSFVPGVSGITRMTSGDYMSYATAQVGAMASSNADSRTVAAVAAALGI